MPSIDTGFTADTPKRITVYYRLFGDTADRTINFDITLKKRKCHHLYDGIVGYTFAGKTIKNSEGGTLDYANDSGMIEAPGETDWNNLEPVNMDNPVLFKPKVIK